MIFYIAIPTLLYECEICTLKQKGYKKTINSRDEIHETYSRIHFTRP